MDQTVSIKELVFLLAFAEILWTGMFLFFYFGPEIRKMRRKEKEMRNQERADAKNAFDSQNFF